MLTWAPFDFFYGAAIKEVDEIDSVEATWRCCTSRVRAASTANHGTAFADHGVGEWAAVLVLGELTQTLHACLHLLMHRDPLVLLNLLCGDPRGLEIQRMPTAKRSVTQHFWKQSRSRAYAGSCAA